MRRWYAVAAVAICFVSSGLAAWPQQLSAEQRRQIAEANKLKAQVSSQIMARKYEQAASSLVQLKEAVDKLKADGVNEKEASLVALERFVDSQQKVLDRYKSKDRPKTGDSLVKQPAPAAPGAVSFVKDVAPILSRNCQRCHGQTTARSKFNLATYSNLMKGGERGSDDIVPGKPEESRLVLMLKGDEQPRMPQGGRALRRDLIELIESWVKQGAKFDGAPMFTTSSTLAEMVPSEEQERRARMAAMSESELLEMRRALAKEHWAAGNPAKSPETTETEHFIVVGTLPVNELEQAGQWAEAAVRDLARIFGRPKDEAWRGKLTIHLFADRHEYTEHAMVVETRSVPRDVFGHYYSMIETIYAALPKPSDDSPASFKGMVVEQAAGAYLAAHGDSPAWFNIGVGRLLAARSDPRAELYREHRQQVREAVSAGDPAAALFDEKGGGDPALLGFGLVEFLATLRGADKGLANLATELRKKTPGDKAIEAVYGLDKQTLSANWSQYALKRYPAKKR
jgi:mono/diheme cytochrome c family protein